MRLLLLRLMPWMLSRPWWRYAVSTARASWMRPQLLRPRGAACTRWRDEHPRNRNPRRHRGRA